MKKDKRVIVSIFWIVLGGTLIALAFAGVVDMFWNGMGSGLLVVGVIHLLRQYRFNKNETYREKIEIEEAYDRNGDAVNTLEIELNPQSLAETLSGSPSQEQTMFWMDNGAFKFLDA